MNIFVAKLNFDTTDDTLNSAFAEFGSVDSAKVIMDRETGRSKGYAFVEMPDDEEAQAAIDALNGVEFEGREIVVKKAEPRENRPRGGGFRGGRGGGNRPPRRDNYNRERNFNRSDDRGDFRERRQTRDRDDNRKDRDDFWN